MINLGSNIDYPYAAFKARHHHEIGKFKIGNSSTWDVIEKEEDAASSDRKSQANHSRRITMQGVSHRVLLAGIALCLSSPVVAQSWPQRPVSIVVPQPAGNSPDVLCRVIADKLSQALGQQFVVENRAGAANLVGTRFVAHAAPDGYTFLFATSAALVMNPYTFKKLSYDPTKDFIPVAMVARSNHVVLVNPEVKAKTLAELIALEKSAPGSLSIAVDGPRNLSGLIAQSINKQAGTGFVLVPYNATTNAVQDSITGRVQATIQAASIAEFFHRGGQAPTHCRCGQQAHRFVAGRAGHLGNAEKCQPARLVHVDGPGRHTHRHHPETQCRDCARLEFCGSARAGSRPRF